MARTADLSVVRAAPAGIAAAIDAYLAHLRDARQSSAPHPARLPPRARRPRRVAGGARRPTSAPSSSSRRAPARVHRRPRRGRRSPATSARRVAAVRAFGRWLAESERLRGNPAAALRAPRRGRKLPHWLETRRGRRAARRAGPATTSAPAATARSSNCCTRTGMRVGELVALTDDAIDLFGGVARRARQGPQGAPGAGRSAGGARARGLPATARRGARPRRRGTRRPSSACAAGRLAAPRRAPDPRARASPLAGLSHEDQPAHPAPQLRHPPAARRRRHPRGAGAARPREPRTPPRSTPT